MRCITVRNVCGVTRFVIEANLQLLAKKLRVYNLLQAFKGALLLIV